MILTCDIIGPFKRTQYGKAGDQVKVISVHGCVLIVEDARGTRFPVNENNLNGDKGSEPAVITPAPATAIQEKKQSVPKKTISKVKPGQQNLF